MKNIGGSIEEIRRGSAVVRAEQSVGPIPFNPCRFALFGRVAQIRIISKPDDPVLSMALFGVFQTGWI